MWTAPKTYAGNSAATSADRNTYERDNLNWLANDRPRCRAVRTSPLSIASGTDTDVTFTAADSYDTGAMHDPASSPERITVPTGGGGVYLVTAYAEIANAAGTRYDYSLKVNGASVLALENHIPSTGHPSSSNLATQINLVATDYLTLVVNQISGGALNLTSAHMEVCWMAF